MQSHNIESLAQVFNNIDPKKLNIGGSTTYDPAGGTLSTITVEYDWANCDDKIKNSFSIEVYGKSESDIEKEVRYHIDRLDKDLGQ